MGILHLTYHSDEEIANTATHGLGLLLSLAGAVAIVAAPGFSEAGRAIACAVYAVTLVIVYAVSTLSHAVQRRRPKYFLRVWDQGVVYLLIAGTYTPLVWAFLSPYWRWIVLAAIWGMALAGFSSKILGRQSITDFSSRSYVLLGWVPALTMVNAVSVACAAWMAVGGMSYTLGTLFLALDRRCRYFHATWHVYVLIGSACHYYAIYRFVALTGALA